jgi:hypothetical protein
VTLREIIEAINGPLAEALDELIKAGERNPDIKPVADQVALLLQTATNDVPGAVAEALEQLKALLASGAGPVTHDPVDLA